MRKPRSILTHIAWLMMVIILISTVGVAIIAARLSSKGVIELAEAEMNEALVQAEGLLLSYVEGEYTKADMERLVNPAFMPSQWYLQLTTPQGDLIAQTQGAEQWFAENTEPDERILLVGELGQQMVRSIAGIDVQSIYTQVVTQEGHQLGSVRIGRQMNAVENKSTLLSQRIILLMLGLLALFALFLFVLGRWVILPVYRLIGASRAMAAGDFHVRADESVPGEVGYLSTVFNNMADELSGTIEELRYEKSSMQLVLEGLHEGILAIDTGGQVIHRNAAFKRLLGERRNQVERRIFTMLSDCLDDGEDRERRHWLDETCFEVIASPILAPQSGARLGAVALVRDVTVQQRLDQTRHDYVANITHELRTPLATMRGLMEPLADGLVEKPEDQQRYYHIVLAEILRLSRLVNDLLELSGLQSGRAGIEREPVDVLQLLSETLERFAGAYAQKGVLWQVELPKEELYVLANEDRLSQVLTILIDNALKYTPAGGRVTLSARRQGENLRFSVRDTGVGISPEDMPHLFDRFYQADRSHSERGNGLGLSIAREVLEKLGLELKAESRLGEGSHFYFDVPLTTGQ